MRGTTLQGLAPLLLLCGCAGGSSMSISQAPLSFVVGEDGSYEIASGDDGTVQALAESGSFETGVAGYGAVGGNALLPVSAVIAASVIVGQDQGGAAPAATAATPAANARLAAGIEPGFEREQWRRRQQWFEQLERREQP